MMRLFKIKKIILIIHLKKHNLLLIIAHTIKGHLLSIIVAIMHNNINLQLACLTMAVLLRNWWIKEVNHQLVDLQQLKSPSSRLTLREMSMVSAAIMLISNPDMMRMHRMTAIISSHLTETKILSVRLCHWWRISIVIPLKFSEETSKGS